jgi:hypothetical protein
MYCQTTERSVVARGLACGRRHLTDLATGP